MKTLILVLIVCLGVAWIGYVAYVQRISPKWERWYAWHPIKISGKWVWRKDVERKRTLGQYELDDKVEYRFVGRS